MGQSESRQQGKPSIPQSLASRPLSREPATAANNSSCAVAQVPSLKNLTEDTGEDPLEDKDAKEDEATSQLFLLDSDSAEDDSPPPSLSPFEDDDAMVDISEDKTNQQVTEENETAIYGDDEEEDEQRMLKKSSQFLEKKDGPPEKEGWIEKQTVKKSLQNFSSWKKRWILLRRARLFYYTSDFVGKFSLQRLKVSSCIVDTKSNPDNGFQFQFRIQVSELQESDLGSSSFEDLALSISDPVDGNSLAKYPSFPALPLVDIGPTPFNHLQHPDSSSTERCDRSTSNPTHSLVIQGSKTEPQMIIAEFGVNNSAEFHSWSKFLYNVQKINQQQNAMFFSDSPPMGETQSMRRIRSRSAPIRTPENIIRVGLIHTFRSHSISMSLTFSSSQFELDQITKRNLARLSGEIQTREGKSGKSYISKLI